ncbi:FadR/GntR family transcriptional regulator [Subtercola endophyticus]|uniref:FadR/GntR family transcriptional regulator n=1 Tax=Subtercola endophyticus TaxID=2895559 RepID=UPI001E60D68E|nr:FadR/GntR family transcriptional regulator [Subtercola endophyticus]UFS58720.1 FadR family transcriptional regulator [Subtercola endophyticus]
MAVTDEAIARIREMVVQGELRPGDRLPPEKELSERLGLSRNSLREAVKALELIRVLDVRRGDGTYVTSLEPGLLLEAVQFVVDLHQDQSVLELFEVRRILETSAAALAAQRMTVENIEHLRASVSEAAGFDKVNDLVAHDLDFHRRIAEASGNTYLSTLLEALSSKTVRARLWRGITEENAASRTLSEHEGIVRAIHARDTELARALTTAHIAGIEGWIRRSLG